MTDIEEICEVIATALAENEGENDYCRFLCAGYAVIQGLELAGYEIVSVED